MGEEIVEQVVDVPVPQVVEEVVQVAKIIPQERVQQRTVEQVVDVPVPQVVTTSLGGGLGAGFSGASAYGSTAAAPVITEVIAAPAITTMAAPVTMAAAPMMTEVIAAPMTTTMAAPMIMEVVGSSAGGWGGAGLTTSVSGGFGAG